MYHSIIHQKSLTHTRQTLVTPRPARIVDALQALARRPIAITHRIRIHIAITVARLAQSHRSRLPIRIAEIPVRALLAPLSEIPDRTLQADDVVAHLQARAILHARTPFAVLHGAHQSVAIESARTLIARVAGRVVLANAPARLRVAVLRMLVAIARNAPRERTATRRTVPESGRARLAELSQIAGGTLALLNPRGRTSRRAARRRLQLDIVQHRFAGRRECAANFDRRQISEDRHEAARRLRRLPRVLAVLVQPELVLAESLVGHRVALREYRQRNPGAGALQNHIGGHGRTALLDQLQPELQQSIVRGALIAQESIGRRKVQLLRAVRRDADVLAVLVVRHVGRMVALVHHRPAFVLLVEIRQRRRLRVALGTLTVRCVAVAEARRAAELVVQIEIEEARLALPAAPALDVVLARADARLRIAGAHILVRAARLTVARLATVQAEVEVVGIAAVAFVAGDARLAVAFLLAVALQRA